jgi:hypothetical protein
MRNLAALAAIGALGYKFGKDRKSKHDPNAVIVEDRGTRSADARREAAAAAAAEAPPAQSQAATVAAPELTAGPRITNAMRAAAEREGANVSAGELAGQSGPAIKPVAAAAPVAGVNTGGGSAAPSRSMAAAVPAAAAPAAAASRRSSYDEENVFNPGQDVGPNISVDVSRRTGVPFNNPAGAGRSSGVGGATAEDIEREQEYNRMVRKAHALADSGIPYKDQTDQSAMVYHRTKTRPSTIKGGRGTATGMKAGDIEAYRRQQEDLKKRGRGFNTTRLAKGGAVKAKGTKMSSGGDTSASKRADGIAVRGKTKCKIY